MKQTIIKTTFLFFITFFLTSCERDNPLEDATQIENQEQTFTIKQYSRNKIEKNTKLVSRLKEFNENLLEKKSAKTSRKNVYNNEYDFTIYTDAATYIQNGDYHSYTFPTVQGTDEKITNILFELNEEDEYDAFLVKYDYTANELKYQDFNSLSMKTSMKPIDLDFNSLFAKTTSAYVCIYSYEEKCTSGWVIGHPELGGGNLGGTETKCGMVLTAWQCENVLYYQEDYKEYHQGTATVTIGGTNYGGTGGSTTSPMPSPFNSEELMKINVVKSELNLSRTERLWIDKWENGGIAFQIYDFGVTNMWDEEAKVFAKLAIEALVSGEIENFNDIIVFDGPDIPITDVQDFLRCFDTNQNATVTIYVTEPNPSSGDTHSGRYVGHTFVSVSQGANVSTYGYYPVSDWISPLNKSGNSVLGNDGSGNEPFTASLSITASGTQLQQIINLSINNNPTYHLDSYNCTDFAIEIGNLAGMNLPQANGTWPGGAGSNPGSLGMKIRNRTLGSGETRDTTGGNAPQTNQGC